MTDKPIHIRASGEHITDHDRETAMWLTMKTGRPAIVNATPAPAPEPCRPWWKFWARKETP